MDRKCQKIRKPFSPSDRYISDPLTLTPVVKPGVSMLLNKVKLKPRYDH
jgi:hypothetical protein